MLRKLCFVTIYKHEIKYVHRMKFFNLEHSIFQNIYKVYTFFWKSFVKTLMQYLKNIEFYIIS